VARSPNARLALGKARKLRSPAKHLAALDAWAETFRDWYPDPSGRAVVHWHLPADQRLVSPPWAEAAHQAHALTALLQAAARLRAARPPARRGETIYVVTHWPEMFMAEVGVFYDAAYAAAFEVRTSPLQTWTPLPAPRSLARELEVDVPPGFEEHGYNERQQDGPSEPVFSSEVWIWREPLPAAEP